MTPQHKLNAVLTAFISGGLAALASLTVQTFNAKGVALLFLVGAGIGVANLLREKPVNPPEPEPVLEPVLHDPLVDPRPGDVLQYGNTIRRVMERNEQDVWYLVNGKPGVQPVRNWTMWSKRKAGDAVVLQRGAPVDANCVDPNWITPELRSRMLELRQKVFADLAQANKLDQTQISGPPVEPAHATDGTPCWCEPQTVKPMGSDPGTGAAA